MAIKQSLAALGVTEAYALGDLDPYSPPPLDLHSDMGISHPKIEQGLSISPVPRMELGL